MRFQQLAGKEIVLRSENLSRGHERGLVSVLDRDHGGFEGDERFSRSDISLQQAAHGNWCLHVGGDLSQNLLLCGRRTEGKEAFDRLAHAIIEFEADSGAPAKVAAFEFQANFEKEQFLKDETAMRRRAATLEGGEALADRREVGLLERLSAAD